MTAQASAVVDTTRDYYDSDDADNFYFHVWGGEDIHVGIYTTADEPIRSASRRTVQQMRERLRGLDAQTRVLDIGSGYAGSARLLAAEVGCKVTALNLSPVQNARAREMNAAQGLAERIEVIDGSFEDLPFAAQRFDVVWCQDSILHSARRARVFAEVDRVLAPGGQFIFTDPMQQDAVDPALLAPVLERIHLPSMGSVTDYRQYAASCGWSEQAWVPMPEMLVTHYSSVLRELSQREAELSAHCSTAYMRRMQQGLRHWISAGQQQALDWGILHFAKLAA